MLTLTTYGAFIPTGADRLLWSHRTAESEARRKGNSDGVVQVVQQRKDATHDV
jgi:hypothetical protein